MTRPIPPELRAPITDLDGAKAWIRALIGSDMLWHFDDSTDDIIDGTGELLWSAADAETISGQRDRLYEIGADWGCYDCPIGYALAYEREIGALDFWTVGDHVEYEGGHLAKVVKASGRWAVIRKDQRFEVAYRDMPMSAEDAWVNPVEGELDYESLEAAAEVMLTLAG